MKTAKARFGTYALALAACASFIPTARRAQVAQTQSTNLIYSLKGQDLYRAYCASCHGLGGKGDGPAAPALKARVPDLTTLADRNHGYFPSQGVERAITGEDVVLSHGSREMPIWGPIFHQIEDDRDFGPVRLKNLLTYLESIQSHKR